MFLFSKYQKQPEKANQYKTISHKKHYAFLSIAFYTLAMATTMVFAGGLYYGFI